MGEIKPNMYVRTKYYIRKIRKIEDGYIYCDIGVFTENEILKASYEITDLIEVGDYVNKREVVDIKMKCDNRIKCLITRGYDITNETIKSIVTKEQMEAIQYVIK